MTNTALAFESIGSLADRFGSGRLSPVTVAEELLQRIEALDGRLDIDDRHDGGTRLQASLPLPR